MFKTSPKRFPPPVYRGIKKVKSIRNSTIFVRKFERKTGRKIFKEYPLTHFKSLPIHEREKLIKYIETDFQTISSLILPETVNNSISIELEGKEKTTLENKKQFEDEREKQYKIESEKLKEEKLNLEELRKQYENEKRIIEEEKLKYEETRKQYDEKQTNYYENEIKNVETFKKQLEEEKINFHDEMNLFNLEKMSWENKKKEEESLLTKKQSELLVIEQHIEFEKTISNTSTSTIQAHRKLLEDERKKVDDDKNTCILRAKSLIEFSSAITERQKDYAGAVDTFKKVLNDFRLLIDSDINALSNSVSEIAKKAVNFMSDDLGIEIQQILSENKTCDEIISNILQPKPTPYGEISFSLEVEDDLRKIFNESEFSNH